jgi:ATP-dependent exoDNAse (exonuclease V) alpha subunit
VGGHAADVVGGAGRNHRARTHLAAEGRLGEAVAQVEDMDTEYAIGDTVVCLRNDRRLGVRNGDLAGTTVSRPGSPAR